MKLVFATNNFNKLKEIRNLAPPDYEILSLNDINCSEDIPETGATLEENAMQKAKYIFENYNINCFADDTGLEVEALNRNPGVFSARYAGENKNAEANIKKLLKELKNVANRNAQFRTVIAAIINGKEFICEGTVKGKIFTKKKGSNGFGYDPVFKPENSNLSFAEMALEEKNKISHRAKAFDKFIEILKKKG